MTKDLYQKRDMVASFFDSTTTDSERKAILSDFGVDYVLWGAAERRLGEFDPVDASYLVPCFTAPEATVYCVQEAQLVIIEH
jgi:uncharacterized membrane protein